jgi:hypothetical protein
MDTKAQSSKRKPSRLKAKESLRAQMTSPSGKEESGSQIHQLRIRLEQVSAKLLEEKKRTLDLCRELAIEKQQNKRPRTSLLELNKTGTNLGSSSALQIQLRIPSTRNGRGRASRVIITIINPTLEQEIHSSSGIIFVNRPQRTLPCTHCNSAGHQLWYTHPQSCSHNGSTVRNNKSTSPSDTGKKSCKDKSSSSMCQAELAPHKSGGHESNACISHDCVLR